MPDYRLGQLQGRTAGGSQAPASPRPGRRGWVGGGRVRAGVGGRGGAGHVAGPAGAVCVGAERADGIAVGGGPAGRGRGPHGRRRAAPGDRAAATVGRRPDRERRAHRGRRSRRGGGAVGARDAALVRPRRARPAGPDDGADARGGGAVTRRAEWGAAVVELLVVFLTLLLPLVYVMVVMADVQRALLATSSAAREAGRVYVTGADRGDAERRAGVAYREVLATYGMRAGDRGTGMRLRVGCPAAAGSGCARGFGPGAGVEVEVTYRVPVARVPFLGVVAGPGVTVGATHHTRVDRYRGLGR